MVNKIVCVWDSGKGSSMMAQLNVEEFLRMTGVDGIQVEYGDSTQMGYCPDCAYVISRSLEQQVPENSPAVVIDQLSNMRELGTKLGEMLHYAGYPSQTRL